MLVLVSGERLRFADSFFSVLRIESKSRQALFFIFGGALDDNNITRFKPYSIAFEGWDECRWLNG